MILSQSYLDSTMDYALYRKLIDDLLTQGKTTGPIQSDEILEYAKMNQQRMKRIESHDSLLPNTTEKLKSINKPLFWLVITEGWCGDAAQIVPFLDKMAQQSPNIKMRLALRDENLELMDNFLTNGGRAIPILVIADAENGNVLTHWGPRPKHAQQIVLDAKANQIPVSQYSRDLHSWYAKDKGRQIQEEVIEILQKI